MSASTITLTDLLPAVFADERERHTSSEVWLTSLRFDRGGRYLVQAESGKGKTSLCAFISGLRTDYNGRIALDGRDYATFLPEERIALDMDRFRIDKIAVKIQKKEQPAKDESSSERSSDSWKSKVQKSERD